MYIDEDELIRLKAVEGIHRDDVAMIIDTSEDYDDLVNELKSYFGLDEKYYEERAHWESIVKKAMDKES